MGLQRDLRFAPVLSLVPTSVLSLHVSLLRRCAPSPSHVPEVTLFYPDKGASQIKTSSLRRASQLVCRDNESRHSLRSLVLRHSLPIPTHTMSSDLLQV